MRKLNSALLLRWLFLVSDELKRKYQKFLESLSNSLELSEDILSFAERNSNDICIFDKFFDGLEFTKFILSEIYRVSSKITFEPIVDYSEFEGKIIGLKAYELEKYYRENEDMYVDLNQNLKYIFEQDD